MKPGQLSTNTHRAQSPVELWGLTGGIGSGKSAAARCFAEFGIEVIDADQIVRELSAPAGAAYPLILQRFGTADRAQLRERVFSNPEARRDLEAILHPLVQTETLRRTQILAETRSRLAPATSAHSRIPVIYEAALLVETGRYRSMDGLIVVDCPREIRKKRLVERDGHTPELAERILNSQTSDQARREAATVIIENSGTLNELKDKVREFCRSRGWLSPS